MKKMLAVLAALTVAVTLLPSVSEAQSRRSRYPYPAYGPSLNQFNPNWVGREAYVRHQYDRRIGTRYSSYGRGYGYNYDGYGYGRSRHGWRGAVGAAVVLGGIIALEKHSQGKQDRDTVAAACLAGDETSCKFFAYKWPKDWPRLARVLADEGDDAPPERE